MMFLWGDPDALRGLLTEVGFDPVELSTTTIEADFEAETFVEDLEYPYGALVPGFLEDPDAFETYVDAVKERRARCSSCTGATIGSFSRGPPTWSSPTARADRLRPGIGRYSASSGSRG
jgi:hypothetical protein